MNIAGIRFFYCSTVSHLVLCSYVRLIYVLMSVVLSYTMYAHLC